jgi:hypothetical protein
MYIALNDSILEYSWFNKEKLFDFDEFFDSLRNFEMHLYKTYLYELNTTENREKIKREFNILVKDFFRKINIDIQFSDIAEIYFSASGCMIVIPYRNLAGIVFFTDKRKDFWNEFVAACKLQNKEKLLRI